MRLGMNLFLWTTDVTPEFYGLFPKLKHTGLGLARTADESILKDLDGN